MNYYPDLNSNSNNFYEKIFQKKEFAKTTILKETKTTEELCEKQANFKLLPQQEFLKNYISVDTPYNGILIVHGTGVGKTCSAIGICEGFRNSDNKLYKKNLIVLSPSIKDNFKKEIYNFNKEKLKKDPSSIVQCTGKTYELGEEAEYLTARQRRNRIEQKIKENYEFAGYEKLTNDIIKNTKWNINEKPTSAIKAYLKKVYSNRVIVIDEVQNIKTSMDITQSIKSQKKIQIVLMELLKNTTNVKLILMTATPMFDKPQEIVFLLNLLLQNDKRDLIDEKTIFNNDGKLKKGGDDILYNVSRGYISYLRGENIYTFPLRIYPENAFTPKLQYYVNGNTIPKELRMKYQKLVNIPMSDIQYNYYLDRLRVTSNEEEKEEDYEYNEENTDESITVQTVIQQISNVIFPLKNKSFNYGFSAFNHYSDNGNGAFFIQSRKLITKKKISYYNYQNHCIFDKNTKNEKPFLDMDYLQDFSPKMSALFNIIKDNRGLVYINSRFIYGGALPIALMLEQNGFERYTFQGEGQLLNYNSNKIGGGGKRRKICYFCGNHANHPFHINKENKDYHEFKTAKYILITNLKESSMSSKIDPSQVAQLVSKPSNKYGKEIKVVIGTKISTEGLDFKNIRQIHLMESWYNLSKHEQIIGRGIRYCSHVDLPDNERNVTIYQYASASALNSSKNQLLTETIDEKNYRIAENKDLNIRKVMHILKKSAVDCVFNKNGNMNIDKDKKKQTLSDGTVRNIVLGDEPYSRNCDYLEDCNYKCAWEPKKKYNIDTDTYQIKFAKQDIQDALSLIKKLYETNTIFTLSQILIQVKKVYHYIDDLFIFKALDLLVNNKKEITYNRYGVKGYLVYFGEYYIFQPLEYDYEQIPMYYRENPQPTKSKSVSVENIKIPKSITNSIQKLINDEKIIKVKKQNKNVDMYSIQEYNKFLNYYMSIYKHTDLKQLDSKMYEKAVFLVYLKLLNVNDTVYYLKKMLLRKLNNKKVKDFDNELFKYKDNFIYYQKEIIGFKFNNYEITYHNKKWSIKELKQKNYKLNRVYGFYEFNKTEKTKFKLVNKTKDSLQITTEGTESKRAVSKGKECKTYEKKELKSIISFLGFPNISLDYDKIRICVIIQIILTIYNDTNKDNLDWIYDTRKINLKKIDF